MKVSVLYCLHPNDDYSRLQKFIAALAIYPSEKAPIFILCKEVRKKSHYEAALKLVQEHVPGIEVRKVPVEGFDLGAYRNFMLASDSEIYILLSSSSIPTSPNWVEKLVNPISQEKTVITGSMVSAESLKSNFALDLAIGVFKRFGLLKHWLPINRIQTAFLKTIGSLLIPVYLFLHPIYSCKRLFLIPKFPNLHLRTTGIAVKKSYYLDTVTRAPKNKIDAFLLESGKNGLGLCGTNSKFVPYLVTASNEYRLDEDYEKNFRKVQGQTPLIVDKHYEEFIFANATRKSFLEIRTWGYE